MIRGLFTFNGVLYAVRSSDLMRIDSAGVSNVVGTLGSAGGPVDFEQNLTQMVLTDGSFLYVWDGATLSTVANWMPGDRIAFVDQRIVGIQRGTQKFGWTALGDARSVQALDFYSAEGSPDGLVSILSSQRELLLLGESSAEVWYSVGGTEVFQRAQSEYIQYGCAAAFSAQLCGDTPVWLGRDRKGQAQVLAGRGQRISTRAIEERFEGLDLQQARAYSYSDGGQRFYCLNVPNVETTLVYDMTFGQWHERAELLNGDYQPWRPTCHAFAYGQHFFGADNDAIYRLAPGVHNFAGDVKCRDRIAPVLSSPSRKRLRFPEVEVICEKADAKKVLLRWSDDNGATWSNWHETSNGAVGNYSHRVKWHRTGSAFDRVYQMRMTDDAPFNPVDVAVEAV
jgi:hypothetical protein